MTNNKNYPRLFTLIDSKKKENTIQFILAQPLLGACAAMSPQAASAAAAPPPPNTHVKALYDYTAKHDDELNLQTGSTHFMNTFTSTTTKKCAVFLDDVIVLLKRRKDGWYQGNLKGKIGFFPGNYVTEL